MMIRNTTLRYLLITIILIGLPALLKAQNDVVTINGRLIDSAYDGGEITCRVIKAGAPLHGNIAFTQSYNAKIIGSQFSIVIPSADEWFDVVFTLSRYNKELLLNSGNVTETTYVLHRGEKVNILISMEGKLIFSGDGAFRLNCQQNLYNLGYIPDGVNSTISDLINARNYKGAIETQFKFFTLNMSMKRALLESYKDSIPSLIFQRIWFDIVGRSYYTMFYSLGIGATSFKPMVPANKILFSKIRREMPSDDTTMEAVNSSYYVSAVLMKEIDRLKYSASEGTTNKVEFEKIYHVIINEYKGTLRDKMLLLAFLTLYTKNSDELNFLSEAINLMGQNSSREMLVDWAKKIQKGSFCYPFDLPDEKGRRVTLESLKGKVIVADFWFKGCYGCTLMPEAMSNVQKKFAGNKNVVFLSINIDKLRKWWMEGLEAKKYTIPGSIHLSLYPLGSNHPLLIQYNYLAFPQLLIIGKDGRTLSSNPPDPRADNGKKLTQFLESFVKDNQ